MAANVARNLGFQIVHFIRRRVQVTDAGLLSGYRIGTIPNRSFIQAVAIHKVTAFNSTATDTLQLGTTAAGVDVLAATDVHTTGYVSLTSAAGLGLAVTTSGDIDIFVKWVSGGGSPNAGDVTVTLAYIPDNDG